MEPPVQAPPPAPAPAPVAATPPPAAPPVQAPPPVVETPVIGVAPPKPSVNPAIKPAGSSKAVGPKPRGNEDAKPASINDDGHVIGRDLTPEEQAEWMRKQKIQSRKDLEAKAARIAAGETA